jgi:predicted dehydrogenase
MIRKSLIGTGGMGTVHFSNYAHIDGCQVVAVVGSAEENGAFAEVRILPLYTNIPSMAEAE